MCRQLQPQPVSELHGSGMRPLAAVKQQLNAELDVRIQPLLYWLCQDAGTADAGAWQVFSPNHNLTGNLAVCYLTACAVFLLLPIAIALSCIYEVDTDAEQDMNLFQLRSIVCNHSQ